MDADVHRRIRNASPTHLVVRAQFVRTFSQRKTVACVILACTRTGRETIYVPAVSSNSLEYHTLSAATLNAALQRFIVDLRQCDTMFTEQRVQQAVRYCVRELKRRKEPLPSYKVFKQQVLQVI